MTERAAAARAEALEALRTHRFDVLVVGAGIVGSRVAFEAARAGLRVALIDAGDFGGGSSGASSKLIHGGFRYLASGQVRLVQRARREQHVLSSRVAPHLVSRLSLVLAVHRDARPGVRTVGAGLVAYNAFAFFRGRRCGRLPDATASALVPGLDTADVAGCGVLHEAVTHDARLTLATVKAAARSGAVVANHVRLVGLEHARGSGATAVVRGLPDEGALSVRSRAVVNATGPSVDAVRRLEDPLAQPLARLSKGAHIVLPQPPGWHAGLAVSLRDNRAVFAVPWYGVLVVGVTDTSFEGAPGDVAASAADAETLRADLRPFLPPDVVDRPLATFAGLRVLPCGDGNTRDASREHVVSVGRRGVVSVAGGKLTMHRWIALDAVRRLPDDVRPRLQRPALDPLPGAEPADAEPPADAETLVHLRSLYGGEVAALAAYSDAPEAFERIHPDAPDVWAQAWYARDREWAVTPDDVARRTTLAVRGLQAEPTAARARRDAASTPL